MREPDVTAEPPTFVRFHPEDMEALAARVADRLGAAAHERNEQLLTAVQAAELLGMSPAWVRAHADDLGVVRLGQGPRPRLRFDAQKVLAFRAAAPEPSPPLAAPHRRKPTTQGPPASRNPPRASQLDGSPDAVKNPGDTFRAVLCPEHIRRSIMSTQMEQGHYTEIDDDRFLVSMAVLVASRDADSVQKAANVAFDRVTSCPSRWMVMDRETDDATWISPEVPEAAAASPDMDVRATALRTAAETPLACAVAAAEAATQAVHLLWRGMTSEEKAAWVLSAADAWPRHDIFLRRLLPVASQIVADEQVADSIRGARIEAAG